MTKKSIKIFVFAAGLIAGLQGALSAHTVCKRTSLSTAAGHSCCPGFQKKITFTPSAALPCTHCLERSALPMGTAKTTAALKQSVFTAPCLLAVPHAVGHVVLKHDLARAAQSVPDPQITITLHRILI